MLRQNLTKHLESFRPQQGLTIMNDYKKIGCCSGRLFPSPTGVNYYESGEFREVYVNRDLGFRPQQGLTIMNTKIYTLNDGTKIGFRPQQGLTIMNNLENITIEVVKILFPSPTGVNYYE